MSAIAENETLLTVDQVAERLQVTRNWVLQKVKEGVIPCIRFNARTFRFHWPTVLAALSKL